MDANTLPADGARPPHTDPASYRDPGGRVFERDGKIYRSIDQRAYDNWKLLASTRFFAQGVASGRIIGTAEAPGIEPIDGEEWVAVLHHERIPVISYPYEWTFAMLKDAALLQLDLLTAALAEDMILKDSTPFNIQWRGHRPVFIDIGSFEPLAEGDVWVGYRQFVSLFLYPLMLTSRVGVPFQPWLRGQPEGLNAEEIHAMMSSRDRWKKGGMLHVSLPAKAERRKAGAGRDVRSELKESGFSKAMIENNVKGLRKIVSSLEWDPGTSRWNEYATECSHVEVQRQTKAEFVERFVTEVSPKTVWDIGANDGHFSRVAAAGAEYVLALDADVVVLEELFESLTKQGPDNVLPLLHDLANPSPGLGWRGAERPPLEGRSKPDLILVLAVVHHLVIGRNVPLSAFMEWLADADCPVVFEFVPPDDPMVQGLTVNKKPHEIHRDYNEEALRSYIAGRFEIIRETAVPGGGRRLFALAPIV